MLFSPKRARAAIVVVALGVAIAPAAAGCIFFSSFDGLTDGGDAGAPDGGDAACGQVKVALCNSIPRAGSGFVQVIDGDAAEFCAIPSATFDPAGGEFRTCPRPPWLEDAAARAVVHLAWSDAAIHAHVRVDKATPVAPSDAGEPYKGDAVELFFGNAEAPTGSFADDHVTIFIIAPPLEKGGSGTLSVSRAFNGEWTTRRDDTGYEVELSIPWSALGGASPASGRPILWNLGLDVAGPSGPRYQAFLRYRLPDGGTAWCNDTPAPKPSVDDESWCHPELAP
jgi:hypothetical protein